MPEYEVLGSSQDYLPVCSLLCWDEEYSRLVVIQVHQMTGEGGWDLVGKKVIIGTTNKLIIPEDISLLEKVEG